MQSVQTFYYKHFTPLLWNQSNHDPPQNLVARQPANTTQIRARLDPQTSEQHQRPIRQAACTPELLLLLLLHIGQRLICKTGRQTNTKCFMCNTKPKYLGEASGCHDTSPLKSIIQCCLFPAFNYTSTFHITKAKAKPTPPDPASTRP